MNKVGLVCYHKNLKQYPEKWIAEFKNSILNQTYKYYRIYEVDYGMGGNRIFENSDYHEHDFSNHAEAMNYIINEAFYDRCDFVGNCNVDDTYANNRLEVQLEYAMVGMDIVSSNFTLFNESGNYHTHNFHNLDITNELKNNHNIICHPVVMYSSRFWLGNRYNPNEIPTEDMNLWQRSMYKYNFYITSDVLCYHREHSNSVGRSKK